MFLVKQGEETTPLYEILDGVPQGCVMGTTEEIVTGTFADDMTVLFADPSPEVSAQKLQTSLGHLSQWLRDWRIKANEVKSVQVIFTIRRCRYMLPC